MDNFSAAGYRVVGLTVQIQQGDLKESLYMPGLNSGDFDEIKDAIEATTEFAVTGFSITARDKRLDDGSFVVPGGTAEIYTKGKIGLKRTVDIGGVETEMKALYIPFMIPADLTKQQDIKAKFVGKTIAGAKITDVVQDKKNSLGK